MSNMKDNIILKGMKIEEAIQKIIEHSTNAVFIVSGDIFCGDIRLCPNRDKARFIYLREDIPFGKSVPDILSDEFVELGAKALDDPLGRTAESYNELKCLSKYKMQKLFCCNLIGTCCKFGN